MFKVLRKSELLERWNGDDRPHIDSVVAVSREFERLGHLYGYLSSIGALQSPATSQPTPTQYCLRRSSASHPPDVSKHGRAHCALQFSHCETGNGISAALILRKWWAVFTE
jgi:hypothetical protein